MDNNLMALEAITKIQESPMWNGEDNQMPDNHGMPNINDVTNTGIPNSIPNTMPPVQPPREEAVQPPKGYQGYEQTAQPRQGGEQLGSPQDTIPNPPQPPVANQPTMASIRADVQTMMSNIQKEIFASQMDVQSKLQNLLSETMQRQTEILNMLNNIK